MRKIYLPLFLVLAGCGTYGPSSMQALNNTSVAVTMLPASPIIVPYAASYYANDARQAASISLGTAPEHYSKEVTRPELFEIARQHGWKFYEPWKYMGTKDGYHYLALYPSLYPSSGFRQIYRIKVGEYPLEDTFPLTSLTTKWRDIVVYSFDGVSYQILIDKDALYVPLSANLYDNRFGSGDDPVRMGIGSGEESIKLNSASLSQSPRNAPIQADARNGSLNENIRFFH